MLFPRHPAARDKEGLLSLPVDCVIPSFLSFRWLYEPPRSSAVYSTPALCFVSEYFVSLSAPIKRSDRKSIQHDRSWKVRDSSGTNDVLLVLPYRPVCTYTDVIYLEPAPNRKPNLYHLKSPENPLISHHNEWKTMTKELDEMGQNLLTLAWGKLYGHHMGSTWQAVRLNLVKTFEKVSKESHYQENVGEILRTR
jgi:hypothetical protein